MPGTSIAFRKLLGTGVGGLLLLLLACGGGEAAPTTAAAPAAPPTKVATAAPTPTQEKAAAPTVSGGAPTGQLRVAQARIGLPQFYPSKISWPNESDRWAYGVHEPPAVMTPAGGQAPRLYESWEISDEGILIRLRKGLQFHKGYGELTAEDVVWSANTTMAPDTVFVNIGFTRMHWDQWRVVDKYTVMAPWKKPAPLFYFWWRNFTAAAPTVFNTFSKKYLDEKGQTPDVDVGVGPFEMMKFEAGNRVELKAVPNHWRETAKFADLTILQVTEPATRLAMIKTGEVDITEIPLASVDKEAQAANLKTHVMGFAGAYCGLSPTGQYYEMTELYKNNEPRDTIYTRKKKEGAASFREWIDTHPWIGDVDDPALMERSRKVRVAMALAINKDSVVKNVLSGHGKTLFAHRLLRDSDGIWLEPGTHARYEKELPPSGDVARAKQLLAEAGFSKGFDAELVITTGARPEVVEISEAIAPMLENVGIRTKISKIDVATSQTLDREKAQDRLSVGCGSREPYPLHIQLTSLGGSSITIPEFKEFIDKSATVGFSLEKLRPLTTASVDIMFKNQYAIAIAQVDRIFVSGPKVGSWTIIGGPGGHPNSFETVGHAK